MIKLILMRHAESIGNATGVYSTQQADRLSANGEQQACAVADVLRHAWRFDQVLVSPLLRTLQTIAPYLKATGRRGEIWPEIAEACWHDEREPVCAAWSSQPASLPSDFSNTFDFRNHEPIRPAHPESFGAGLRRVHDALQMIEQMANQADISILMVTHGHFIRELLNLMLETRETIRFKHDNTGMTAMTFTDRWAMDFSNRLYGFADAEES
jgi:broad specificity phosphatase PhoE